MLSITHFLRGLDRWTSRVELPSECGMWPMEKFKGLKGTKFSNCWRNLTVEVIEGKVKASLARKTEITGAGVDFTGETTATIFACSTEAAAVDVVTAWTLSCEEGCLELQQRRSLIFMATWFG